MDLGQRRAYHVLQDSKSGKMSSLDSMLLDYITAVKSNWTDWQITHGKVFMHSTEHCQLCTRILGADERFVRLTEYKTSRTYCHESCLESLVRENPDLRGRLRL